MLADDQPYQIILDNLYTSSQWSDLIQATSEIVSIAGRHQLGLGAFGSPPFMHPEPDQATYNAISKAVAIHLNMAWLLPREDLAAR